MRKFLEHEEDPRARLGALECLAVYGDSEALEEIRGMENLDLQGFPHVVLNTLEYVCERRVELGLD